MNLYQPQLLYLDAGQQLDRLAEIRDKLIAAPATEATLILVRDAIDDLVVALSSNATPADPSTATHQITQIARLEQIRDFLGNIRTYTDSLELLLTSLNGYVDGLETLLGTANTTQSAIAGFVDQLEGFVDGIEPRLDTIAGNQSTAINRLPTGLTSSGRFKTEALAKTIAKKFRDDFSGTVLDPAKWTVVQTGAGQSISVGSSNLTIATGVTANAETIIRSIDTYTIPFRVFAISMISQRIVNQEFYIEIVDASGTHYARWIFDGTSATAGRIQVANNGDSLGVSPISILSTATQIIWEIDTSNDEINFYQRSTDTNTIRGGNGAARTRQIPDPTLEYYVQIRAKNLGTAPVSNTNFIFDSISIQDIETLTTEVIAGRGGGGGNQAIPVTGSGGGSLLVANSSTLPLFVADVQSNTIEFASPLTANQSLQGTSRDSAGLRNVVRGWVFTDQNGTLFADQSTDNSTYRQTYSFSITGNASQVTPYEFKLLARYWRLRYANGAVAQTTMQVIATQFNIGA